MQMPPVVAVAQMTAGAAEQASRETEPPSEVSEGTSSSAGGIEDS